jgi:hypothetical protein
MASDSYANYPPSVNEVRSMRSGNAADWSPREALIQMLRDIDSGAIQPDALIVSFRERVGCNYRTNFGIHGVSRWFKPDRVKCCCKWLNSCPYSHSYH